MKKSDLEKIRDEKADKYRREIVPCADHGIDYKEGFNVCLELLWPRLNHSLGMIVICKSMFEWYRDNVDDIHPWDNQAHNNFIIDLENYTKDYDSKALTQHGVSDDE